EEGRLSLWLAAGHGGGRRLDWHTAWCRDGCAADNRTRNRNRASKRYAIVSLRRIRIAGVVRIVALPRHDGPDDARRRRCHGGRRSARGDARWKNHDAVVHRHAGRACLTRREHITADATQDDVERLPFRHCLEIQCGRSAGKTITVDDLKASKL